MLMGVAYLLKIIPVLLVFFGILTVMPLLVFIERKVSAWIQGRWGPNRVGLLGPDSPFESLGLKTGSRRFLGGLLQPVADAVKLFTKELIVPAGAERALYFAAPIFALLPPLLAFVVIPVGPDLKLELRIITCRCTPDACFASVRAYGATLRQCPFTNLLQPRQFTGHLSTL